MIIEYQNLGNGLKKVRKITSEDDENVASFGYAFSSVMLRIDEILSYKEFKNKIQRIRRCNERSLGKRKGKVNVRVWRSDSK